MQRKSWTMLIAGLAVGSLLMCCLLVVCVGGGLVFSPFAQPTQVPIIARPTVIIPTITPLVITSPTSVPSTASVITNAVMASSVSGNLEPIGITNTFGPEQAVFFAVATLSNAPAGTTLKAKWTALDTGGIVAPNTLIGETEVSAEGSRNVVFTFKPNAGRLPQGNYQVDIYVNNKLERTVRFTVKDTPASTSSCPPVPTPVTRPSNFVASVTMALDVTADKKDPVNPTTVFTPNATFHAVVSLRNAPANTKVSTTWYATDVGTAAPCNSRIDSAEVITDGTRNIDFTLKPRTQWPSGTYRVEISINDVLDRVVHFSVK